MQIIESWKYVQLDRKEKIEWLKTEATLAQYDLGKGFVLILIITSRRPKLFNKSKLATKFLI